ncbi:MAG: DUF5106 domain-containing protein [Muribaculaceae bacterium]|nr:DUF5106 domain-containing protein [Muribaculaceae bacterium]MBR3101447.1 DUF5106 domain-containing protein [Muribaculaceae bacterium]
MRKTFLFAILTAFACLSAGAQMKALNTEMFEELLRQANAQPIGNAKLLLSSTVNALSSNPKAYRKAIEVAEKRLSTPTDSLHNEELYIALLENAINNYVLSGGEKERPRLLLENAKRNRIGTVAADIDYVTRDGKKHLMSEITSPLTLVYFNDPDCDACEQVKERLGTSALVRDMVNSGKLTVLAIYTGADQKLWKKTDYPQTVINGWNKSASIEDNGTYILPSMPLFYLLDSDKKVLMKNEPSLKRVEERLQQEQ